MEPPTSKSKVVTKAKKQNTSKTTTSSSSTASTAAAAGAPPAPAPAKRSSKPSKSERKKKKQQKAAASASSAAAAEAVPLTLIRPLLIPGATLSDRLNPTHPKHDRVLKEAWGTMNKRTRKAYIDADASFLTTRAEAIKPPETYAFEAVEDDHCETGQEAFEDIVPVLKAIAKDRLGKDADPSALRIYDPYYCSGASARHLSALGFPNVYNENEDFYEAWAKGTVPQFDVLVTNPAYSGDHCARLLDICAGLGKPFLLLMPCWVCGKDFFAKAAGRGKAGGMGLLRAPGSFQQQEAAAAAAAGPNAAGSGLPSYQPYQPQQQQGNAFSNLVYLFPPKRYYYWTPKGLRSEKDKTQGHSSALGVRTSPFVSMWFTNFGPRHSQVLSSLVPGVRMGDVPIEGSRLRLAYQLSDLPPALRPENTVITAPSANAAGGGAAASSSSSSFNNNNNNNVGNKRSFPNDSSSSSSFGGAPRRGPFTGASAPSSSSFRGPSSAGTRRPGAFDDGNKKARSEAPGRWRADE